MPETIHYSAYQTTQLYKHYMIVIQRSYQEYREKHYRSYYGYEDEDEDEEQSPFEFRIEVFNLETEKPEKVTIRGDPSHLYSSNRSCRKGGNEIIVYNEEGYEIVGFNIAILTLNDDSDSGNFCYTRESF